MTPTTSAMSANPTLGSLPQSEFVPLHWRLEDDKSRLSITDMSEFSSHLKEHQIVQS